MEKVGCKPLNFDNNGVNKSKNYFGSALLNICSPKVHSKLMGYPYCENKKVILSTKGSESGITF